MSNRSVDNKNPFFSENDDDDDDASFGRYGGGTSSDNDRGRSHLDQLQARKEQSMNRQLETTGRCLASLYESEQIGIDTAEDLVRQGEQLNKIETGLDKINQDTKTSQRHLNSIKSVFGGIKNWWAGGKEADASRNSASNKPTLKLQATVDQRGDQQGDSGLRGDHPGLRLNDAQRFYDDDSWGAPVTSSGQRSGDAVKASSSSLRTPPGSVRIQTQEQKPKNAEVSSGFKEYDEKLESDLELMSGGLARLKDLGLNLGQEIEKQNDQVTRITGKADRADITIRDQNRQMKKILGK